MIFSWKSLAVTMYLFSPTIELEPETVVETTTEGQTVTNNDSYVEDPASGEEQLQDFGRLTPPTAKASIQIEGEHLSIGLN